MHEREDEHLQELRREADEALRLWSNAEKPERERMVCRAFLRCLGLSFDEKEIKIGSTEPVDVSFRSANFQIMEIMEEGRRRTDEWRKRQRRRQEARSLGDLIEPYTPSRGVSYSEILSCLDERLRKKAALYSTAVRAKLDILIYINLHNSHLDVSSEHPAPDQLQKQGWRSVSMLFLPYGEVLFAREGAPEFLRHAEGHALMKWQRLAGWFDA